jgi:hypothetical protein
MKKETISQVDLNFTNSGGGHTASVTTILSAKNLDGSHGLGTVVGDLGEINSFSNEKIGSMLRGFICTDLTTTADPTKNTISRKYVDKTSLILKSIVVLVRGVNCSPAGGLNFEGEEGRARPISYFSEVSNSPLEAFPSNGPERHGSVICAGRVYNYEAGAKFDGTKIALCYNDHELIPELCLNLDFVSDDYKASPDLAQYELKFGYTLDDVKEMCNLAGVKVEGLPSADDVMLEASGTLESVLGSVASTLGCFWYVDPEKGFVKFISTAEASAIEITDYTDTTKNRDTNIINASFSESLVTSQLVNSYTGSADKLGDSESSGPDENRPRPVFFKRVNLAMAKLSIPAKGIGGGEALASMGGLPSQDILQTFFSLFNQGEDAEIFDKYFYLLSHLKKNKHADEEGAGEVGIKPMESPLPAIFDDPKPLNWSDVYEWNPMDNEIWAFGPDIEDNDMRGWTEDNGATIFAMKGARFDAQNPSDIGTHEEDGEKKGTPLKRTNLKGFYYRLLKSWEAGIMPKPSQKKIYTQLQAFYGIAGGIFISNGYSKYKAQRIQFSNSNNATIMGPFKGTENIVNIDELSPINDALDQISWPVQFRTIYHFSLGNDDVIGDEDSYYFIALRNIAKLERKPIKEKEGDPPTRFIVDFSPLADYCEFFQDPRSENALYIGGPWMVNGENVDISSGRIVVDLLKQSKLNYNLATGANLPPFSKEKNQLRLEYTRSKTRVNKLSEEGEEKEDDDIARGSAGSQKESDLADRYDLRRYTVVAPPHSILNNLSLATASGSTIEMNILQGLRPELTQGVDKPKSSSRTLYGLHAPVFSPEINSVSVTVGAGGIQTTINESSIKLIPPAQSVLMQRGMEALTPQSPQAAFNARQRNALKL